MSKFIPALSLESSPITKNREIVSSRLSSKMDSNGNVIHGSLLIDKADIVNILEWLDAKTPLLWATKSLEKSANDMRRALMEIMEVV